MSDSDMKDVDTSTVVKDLETGEVEKLDPNSGSNSVHPHDGFVAQIA